jgi:hypothetical protein
MAAKKASGVKAPKRNGIWVSRVNGKTITAEEVNRVIDETRREREEQRLEPSSKEKKKISAKRER